jgi:hypothetical protein
MKLMSRTAMAWVLLLGVASWGLAADSPRPKAKRRPAEVPTAAPVQYDVLYQVHLPTFAELIVTKINEAAQKDLANRRAGESDEDHAIRKQFTTGLVELVSTGVKELDNVSLGWRLDKKSKQTSVDLTLTALPGTRAAADLAQVAELKTAFSGFTVPGCVLTAHVVGHSPAYKTEAGVKLIQALRTKELGKIDREGISDDEKAIRKDLLNKLFDVLRDSVASGRSDGGLSLTIQSQSVTLIAGGYVADGAKLESVIKPIGTHLQQVHPLFAGLKFDVEKCEGVNLHTLSIPAPGGNDREKFVKLFGESLEVVLGFGKEAVYLAAGKDAMKSLQAAIRKSVTPAKPDLPFEVSLALKPLADFVAAMGKDHEKGPAQQVASVLAQAPGKDHVRLLAKPIERGVVLRLEAEEGILQLIGSVSPEAKAFLLGK